MAALAQITVSLMRRHLPDMLYREAAPDPLFYGLLATIALGAFFGWRRSRPIGNVWQRGVIAVLSAVGALLIGFFGAIADRVFGFTGLVAWGVATTAFGVAGSRWAVRAADPAGTDGPVRSE